MKLRLYISEVSSEQFTSPKIPGFTTDYDGVEVVMSKYVVGKWQV